MPIVESEEPVSIEFYVYCADCGEGLCDTVEVDNTTPTPSVKIPPCKACMDSARDNGFDAGRDQGKREGYDEGYDAGFEEGTNYDPQEVVYYDESP